MKRIRFISKGILLYVTTLITALYICGIDSIIEQGYFIHWTLITIISIYICYKYISYRELYVLTLNRWFNNLIK